MEAKTAKSGGSVTRGVLGGRGPAASLVLGALRRLRSGGFFLVMPDGSREGMGQPAPSAPQLVVRDHRFFARVLRGGSIGFGEAYVEGMWDTDDLQALLLILARNQGELGVLRRGLSAIRRRLEWVRHIARPNTRRGSRANIGAHYDLSNAFYATFLDPGMTYSSALFEDGETTLGAAQTRKLDRLLDLTGARPGSHLLEIGSGWGSFAARAVEHGYRVTTVTLSEEQWRLARERLEARGASERAEVLLCDYRELSGRYDAVVSCEMIEAVGRRFLPGFFETLAGLLRPGAKAVLQAITIPDARYRSYRANPDWIQKHIFPGGHLPSPGIIRKFAGRSGGLSVERDTAFGGDYARTLRCWREAFDAASEQVEALGFDAAFRRKWRYYLAYCEAGFRAGLIDVRHLVLA